MAKINNRIKSSLGGYPQRVRYAFLIVTIAFFALLLCDFFTDADYSASGIITFAAEAICILLINFYPRNIIIIYTIVFFISACLPLSIDLTFESTWLVLLYSGIVFPSLWPLLFFGIVSSGQVLSYLIYSDTTFSRMGVISTIAVFLLFTSIGIGVNYYNRIQNQRVYLLEAAKDRQALSHLEFKHKIALELHNSLAGNLTDIILLEQQNNDTVEIEKLKERNTVIYQLAMKCLNEAHQIINTLSTETANLSNIDDLYDSTMIHNNKHLKRFSDSEDNRLRILGFHGKTQIHQLSILSGENKLVTNADDSLILILKEIYNNIAKYASRDSDYSVVINYSQEGIALYTENSLSEELNKTVQNGLGLTLLKRTVENAGGLMNNSIHDDRFNLKIYLPC